MAGVDSWQSCYAALPFRVCVKGQEGNAGWIFSIFSPWSMMKRQQDCDIQRCCCYRHSALAGVEGELGGAGFLHVSRRQQDLCAWVSVQRKAVVQFVISASGLWEQRDFYCGECAGEGATALKKKSLVPLCDSKIFREICALYAVGILKQGIGTSIIQKQARCLEKTDRQLVCAQLVVVRNPSLPGLKTSRSSQALTSWHRVCSAKAQWWHEAFQGCREMQTIPSFSLCWGSCW